MEEQMQETKENLHFEDEYDDVYEKEDIVPDVSEENSDDYESVEDSDEDREMMMEETKPKEKKYKEKEKKVVGFADKEDAPYVGTGLELEEDEFLDFENCTYEMLHRSTTEWPCMSIDWLLPDYPLINNYSLPRLNPIQKELNYPCECYAVAGSMASVSSKNQIYVLKFSNLAKTKYDDDSEISADDDEE